MIHTLLDLLFPPKCPFCTRLLEDGQALLCPDCQRDLPWALGAQGEQKGEFFELCTAPLWYRERVRESHHRYKFSGVRAYAKPYAELMAQCAQDRLSVTFDVVTWVPIHSARRWKRGYDQSELLARRLACVMGLPCERLLKKVRHTKAQSGLKGESVRRANVLGASLLQPGVQVEGKRILLVDDVATTGATLSECARMLRTAGAVQVFCVTLAMVRPNEK